MVNVSSACGKRVSGNKAASVYSVVNGEVLCRSRQRCADAERWHVLDDDAGSLGSEPFVDVRRALRGSSIGATRKYFWIY